MKYAKTMFGLAAGVAMFLAGELPRAGAFWIESASSGKVLDVPNSSTTSGTFIQQYTRHAGRNQQWRFTYLGSGFWSIRNLHSGLVLDVPGLSLNRGTPIQQYTWNGGHNQQWQLVEPNGTVSQGTLRFGVPYKIVNRRSGLVLDVPGFSPNNGAIIQQFTDNGGANQKWYLVPTSSDF